MKTPRLIFSILTLALVIQTNVVFAEDSGGEHGSKETEEEKPSSASESKEEGKEGAGGFIKKDEFLELNSSIEQMSAKIKSRSEDLKKTLFEKEKVKDPAEYKKIVKEIQTTYREIKDLTESIEKKKTIIKHRFPERSFVKSNDKSKFQKIEDISVDAMLERQVDQLLATVESQYQFTVRKKQKQKQKQETKSHRGPASEEKTHSTEETVDQNPYDFSHSLILKK